MKKLSSSRFLMAAIAILLLVVPALGAEEKTGDEPLVSVMFLENDIREALSEITLQTGINIIPDQTVSGTVTADFQDVPLEKALRMLLIGGGFTFRKIDDFYLVGLPDPRNLSFGELAETEIIELEGLTAGEVLAQLPAFLANYVKGASDGRVLTIMAPPAEMERIKDLIKKLDRPKRSVEIKVLVTEISAEAVKDFGNSLFQYAAAKGQTVNENWTGTIGFERGLLSLDTDIYGDLLTTLRLLEEKNKAKIEANPRVVVADGRSAELFLGDQRVQLLNADDDDVTTRVERLEVGVRFKVTPTVVGKDEVILELSPEVSHLVDQSNSDLVIRQSTVATAVRLKSGQTVAISGMTLVEEAESKAGVPVLGQIPLVRWFFRNDVDRQSEREFLVFVTPVIQ